tara:strand:+ start:207 stop:386 length:180 start_codon:yes stop_codon:yes gene_type:complete
MENKIFKYDLKCSYEQNKLNFINQAYFERSDAQKQGFPEAEFDAKKVEVRFDDLFSHKK